VHFFMPPPGSHTSKNRLSPAIVSTCLQTSDKYAMPTSLF
jgi:hypothetical protein